MPKQAVGSGTNAAGNSYTSYSDGSYRYSNSGGGQYYGDRSGNGFYTDSSRGYSSYTRSDGSGWTQQGGTRTSK